jgi:hypothetical protein
VDTKIVWFADFGIKRPASFVDRGLSAVERSNLWFDFSGVAQRGCGWPLFWGYRMGNVWVGDKAWLINWKFLGCCEYVRAQAVWYTYSGSNVIDNALASWLEVIISILSPG